MKCQCKLYYLTDDFDGGSVVCVIFSTNSVNDILMLLTFICSLVSDVSQEELEKLKVRSSSFL